MSTRVSKPNVVDEHFNEQNKKEKICFVDMSRRLCV